MGGTLTKTDAFYIPAKKICGRLRRKNVDHKSRSNYFWMTFIFRMSTKFVWFSPQCFQAVIILTGTVLARFKLRFFTADFIFLETGSLTGRTQKWSLPVRIIRSDSLGALFSDCRLQKLIVHMRDLEFLRI